MPRLFHSGAAAALAAFCIAAIPLTAQACGDCGSSCTACACGCAGATLQEASSSVLAASAAYRSRNTELLGHLSLPEMTLTGNAGGILGSDLWGWSDPQTGRDYVLYGKRNGTAIVDVTDATAPRYLGDIPTATGSSDWREIKTYGNYALIVSDANNSHGMQVFDMTRLRGLTEVTAPQTFTADTRYTGVGNVHNLFVNQSTGFVYLTGMGRNNASAPVFNGGLHMLSMADPLHPTLVGGYAGDGYTHDVQVVSYGGPDGRYTGREIAFASNEDTLTIVDVTNKTSPTQLSRRGYTGAAYSHQGWLSDDGHYFFMNDELDEVNFGGNTKTHIWDVSDLTAPVYRGSFTNPDTVAIDHNMFLRGSLLYQSNYSSGLRVWDMSALLAGTGSPSELGFFDTYFQDDANPEVSFNGAWGNYPFFANGVIAVGDRQNGLYLVRVTAVPEPGTGALALLSGAITAGAARYNKRRCLKKKRKT